MADITLPQLNVYFLTSSQIVSVKTVTTVPYVSPEIIRIILSLPKDDKKTLTAFSPLMAYKKSSSDIQNDVTPELLIQILRSFPQLTAFSVSESLESVITLEVLNILLLECKNIKIVDFCGCSSNQFSNALEDFCHLIGGVKVEQYCDNNYELINFHINCKPLLSHIRRLSLHESKCKNISSIAISSFISKCSQLKSLNLFSKSSANTGIKEHDLITILQSPSAKNFQTLDIGSSEITPLILTTIKENCLSLQYLGISKAQVININIIKDFLIALTNLQYINLTSIPCFDILNTNNLFTSIIKSNHSIHTIEMSESLLKKHHVINGWEIELYYGRRWYCSRNVKNGAIRSN
ncbi:16187_t:CDS:2 [Dentiscutata erythropus]|uniref:16187_t:CDS:1 n=1 Tax=Dentiscutata erythropus TaxID=1348616 RepID=A0A9N8ZEF1_9GLOM|nr:16187_t:CDS:2 [Dentiscutata erythropus]